MDTQPGQNGAGAADREGVQETAARHGADASASRSAQPEWPYSGQPAESVHEAQPSVPDDEFAEQLDIAVAETAEQNDLTLGRERMSLVRHEVLSTPLAAEEDPNVDGVPRTAVQEAAQADGIGIDPASQGKHPKHAAGALESQSTSAIATAGSAYFQYQGRQAGVTDYHRYAQDQMRRIAEAAALTATGDSASRKPLPELEASWLSRWTFWWFGSLIWRGWRRTLDDSDLYELADRKSVV